MDLSVEIAGIKFKNPVIAASGTFGFGEEFAGLIDLNQLGGIVCKTITKEPREGNPPPRIAETASGMLNSIGLQNPGYEVFVKEKLPFLRKYNANIIVSIAGKTVEEYGELAGILKSIEGISALEVNISCPNVKEGGLAFGTNPVLAAEITHGVKKNTNLPVIVKLTPNVTDIKVIAEAVEKAGADAISAINTLGAMSIDIYTGESRIANVFAGLSGPCIRPVAVKMVYQIYETVKIPVIGIGGISSWMDAVEFFRAGASAIQVGTANFVEPRTMPQIIAGLKRFMEEQKISDIKELIGSIKT